MPHRALIEKQCEAPPRSAPTRGRALGQTQRRRCLPNRRRKVGRARRTASGKRLVHRDASAPRIGRSQSPEGVLDTPINLGEIEYLCFGEVYREFGLQNYCINRHDEPAIELTPPTLAARERALPRNGFVFECSSSTGTSTIQYNRIDGQIENFRVKRRNKLPGALPFQPRRRKTVCIVIHENRRS